MYLAGVMLSCLPVAAQAVVQCWGHMRMLPVVAVQMPWDIARCMLMVVHCNAGICMSGVMSHLCTVHGCTITSGCAGGEGDCVGDVCGCVGTRGVCQRR